MNANRPMTELLPPPSFAKPDIVRRFLAWAQSADAEARAEAASALARAYLHSELTAPVRAEAVLAMTALLDDPSVLVRQALAEALCHSSEAPRPLILALAADEPEVAAAVLRRSPVLTEADLVDSRREWRRRRPDGARAPAQPAARGGRCAGRERATGCGSRADRQSRDRSSGRIAFSHLCPLQRRCERARGAA